MLYPFLFPSDGEGLRRHAACRRCSVIRGKYPEAMPSIRLLNALLSVEVELSTLSGYSRAPNGRLAITSRSTKPGRF